MGFLASSSFIMKLTKSFCIIFSRAPINAASVFGFWPNSHAIRGCARATTCFLRTIFISQERFPAHEATSFFFVFKIISQRRFVQFLSVLLSPFSFILNSVFARALFAKRGSLTNSLKNNAALSARHRFSRCFCPMKRSMLLFCYQLQIVKGVISFIAIFMMQFVSIRNFSPVSLPKIMVQQCVRTIRKLEISVLEIVVGLSVETGIFGNSAHLVCSKIIFYAHVIFSSYVKCNQLHMKTQGESYVY